MPCLLIYQMHLVMFCRSHLQRYKLTWVIVILTGDKYFSAVLTCVWMKWQKCGGHEEAWHSVTGLADCDAFSTDSLGTWVKRWRRWRVRLGLNRRTCFIAATRTLLISGHSLRWCYRWLVGTAEMCLPTLVPHSSIILGNLLCGHSKRQKRMRKL